MTPSDKIADSVEVDGLRRRKFVGLLLAMLLALFFFIVARLLVGVIAGLILWVFTEPLFNMWVKRMPKHKSWAAVLSLVSTILIVVVPIVLISMMMAFDAAELASDVQSWVEANKPEIQSRLNKILRSETVYIFKYPIAIGNIGEQLQAYAGGAGEWVLGVLKMTAGGLAGAAVALFVTLYTLFFCYLDGHRFLAWLKRILPLTDDQTDRLLNDFFTTSRATLKTVGVIGAVQGTMGGVAFWICGIPAPFFWTVLMAFASIIPAVGAQIILFPAAIILVLIGKTWYGIGLFLWSWIVIANIDNILRPYLVSREIKLHELLIFLTTIGGIAVFGFFGFLVGPVVAALLKATFAIYEETNAHT